MLIALATGTGPAQEVGPPISQSEELRYTITWPSGLPVGRAEFRARDLDPGWRFEMTLRASLPQIEIDDAFVSRTDAGLCSQTFEKHVRHGAKRAHESLRFGSGELERSNMEASALEPPGRTPIGDCARDALAHLYFLRHDLAAGRITPPADVFFGAGYRVRMEFVRTRWLSISGGRRLADEILAVVKGPASEHAFTIYFGRDPARTLFLVRAEFEEGPFSMQLMEE